MGQDCHDRLTLEGVQGTVKTQHYPLPHYREGQLILVHPILRRVHKALKRKPTAYSPLPIGRFLLRLWCKGDRAISLYQLSNIARSGRPGQTLLPEGFQRVLYEFFRLFGIVQVILHF